MSYMLGRLNRYGGKLGALGADNPCDPVCRQDAVTVFSGRDFTGSRFEMRGSGAGVTASNASRKEGMWLKGSLYVPAGFVVLLIEDANFFKRDRRNQQTITGPWQGNTPSWPVVIIAVQDARTAEQKNRAGQIDAIAREAEASQLERQSAEIAAREAQRTADLLEQFKAEQARRESQRATVMEAQAREAAEQVAQQTMARREAELKAEMQAAQQRDQAIAAYRAQAGAKKKNPYLIPAAGGAIALLLVFGIAATRKPRRK